MNAEHKTYIRNETIVSIIINAAAGLFFAWLVFGSMDGVPLLGGMGTLLFDSAPQSFLIAFLVTLILTLVTRKRLRDGKLTAVQNAEPHWLPKNLLLRALLLGTVTCLIGVGLHWLLLPLISPAIWPVAAVLVFKAAYGGLLGLLIPPLALAAVLREPISPE